MDIIRKLLCCRGTFTWHLIYCKFTGGIKTKQKKISGFCSFRGKSPSPYAFPVRCRWVESWSELITTISFDNTCNSAQTRSNIFQDRFYTTWNTQVVYFFLMEAASSCTEQIKPGRKSDNVCRVQNWHISGLLTLPFLKTWLRPGPHVNCYF